MILIRFSGGLGNQMFQFATAYACAKRLNTHVVADLDLYKKNTIHQGFQLNRVFGLDIQEVNLKERIKFFRTLSYRKIKKKFPVEVLYWLEPRRLVLEPHFHYWPEILNVVNNSYLEGYWQSEKYFDDITSDLHKLYQFKLPLNSTNAQLFEKISSEQSVSLHVRRGDYVNNKNNKKIHDVNLISYYRKATRLILESVPDAKFYLFTDDYDWVSKNIELQKMSNIVKNNVGINSFVDMQLMSKCKHHIIANSSFSWWGSWLSQSRNKITICPKQWFTEDAMQTRDPCDLYPSNAVVI